MQLIGDKISVFGSVDDAAIQQISRAALDPRVVRASVSADGHLGYGVPIGGVVAYKDAISPTGVGYDIACGNQAVMTDMSGTELRKNIVQIMDDIWSTLSFGVGRKNNEKVDLGDLESHEAWGIPAVLALKDKAAGQLGTIGSGNHFVDLFVDEEDRVWVGVHFGSRGFGHGIATHFLTEGGAKDGMDVDPLVLPVNSDLGASYLSAMSLAGEYAYAGRNWVCDRVVKILGANSLEEIHNHHNFAWLEEHNGEKLWVVRKGSTPAFPGQRGFVGATMGETSVIIEGVENENAKYSLYSTVHGAGRAMGRMEAKGKIDKKTGEVKRIGRVTSDLMSGWIDRSGIELRGADIDESPDCYKRLDSVLDACGDSIKILHRLTPVGVAMAGRNEFDPYKD